MAVRSIVLVADFFVEKIAQGIYMFSFCTALSVSLVLHLTKVIPYGSCRKFRVVGFNYYWCCWVHAKLQNKMVYYLMQHDKNYSWQIAHCSPIHPNQYLWYYQDL